jgi:hypothetical protein
MRNEHEEFALQKLITKSRICCKNRKKKFPDGIKKCPCLSCHVTAAYLAYKNHNKHNTKGA